MLRSTLQVIENMKFYISGQKANFATFYQQLIIIIYYNLSIKEKHTRIQNCNHDWFWVILLITNEMVFDNGLLSKYW
jgi:hypothetical protein